MIQMINLLGVEQNDWRANEGIKETPEHINDFVVKYYPEAEIDSVWLASPDDNDNRSTELTYQTGDDGGGTYIQFEVPSLEYWNMIYMKKK